MVITFYNTASDPRAVEKILGTSTGSATGVLHERVNSLQMTVRLPGTVYNVVTQSNYVMLDLTQKYYYIDSYEVQNDCCYINLREDVLYSFASQIKNLDCTILRSEKYSNAYLLDNGYQILAYDNIVTKEFPSGLTDESIVLLTVG